MTFKEERRFYVYAWYIVDTFEIFYIGKGTGNRYKTKKRENSYFSKMVQTHNCDSVILMNGLTEKEAFEYEKILISYCRGKFNRLTNVLDGGEQPPSTAGTKRTKETKDKMRKSMIQTYKNHPELKEKASERMKRFLKTEKGREFQRKSIASRDNDEFRKSQSVKCRKANRTPEYIEKQSRIVKEMWKSEDYANAHKGENNGRSQRVKQYDLDGNFIKEYETIAQACKETGVSQPKVTLVCKGRRKTTGGFIWKYSNDKHLSSSRNNTYDPEKDKNAKRVLQYDKNGRFIKEYYSINDVVRQNPKMMRSAIQQNLKGNTKSSYGYVWKFK